MTPEMQSSLLREDMPNLIVSGFLSVYRGTDEDSGSLFAAYHCTQERHDRDGSCHHAFPANSEPHGAWNASVHPARVRRAGDAGRGADAAGSGCARR